MMSEHLIKSYNPATQELLFETEASDQKTVQLAIQKAKEAFSSWSRLPDTKRIEHLKHFAELLKKRAQEFASIISQENGKPLWDALFEVNAMVNKVDISIQAKRTRCHEIAFSQGNAQAITRFKPHGVLAVFGPFNFPGHLPNGHIVPALLAGNTIVFKPSELTPLVGESLVKLYQEAGLPDGVLNLLQGGPAAGKEIISHPDISGALFTGSAKTGEFLQKSLPFTKILALEMGGNNPLVISQCDDVTAASELTIQSAYVTSGQRCTAARRLIVIENNSNEAFLKELIKKTSEITVGSYTDRPEPFMGPVINNAAAEKLLLAQQTLERQGGKPLLEMHRINPNLPFLTPGLIDVTAVRNRKDEEIFGPLLQLIRVANLQEAIDEANATAYGLSSGFVSQSREEYELFWQQIRAGVVNWNMPLTGASSKAPFGGIGLSGNHRPSALFAADYCAYPVASLEREKFSDKETG